MSKLTLKTDTEQGFFRRGKSLAQLADRAQALPAEQVISFEDPADMLRLLTATRLDVLRAVKDGPGSITMIAQRLQRDRSAVKRDIDQLALVGMVSIESKLFPGHGRMKEVRTTATRFKIEAVV